MQLGSNTKGSEKGVRCYSSVPWTLPPKQHKIQTHKMAETVKFKMEEVGNFKMGEVLAPQHKQAKETSLSAEQAEKILNFVTLSKMESACNVKVEEFFSRANVFQFLWAASSSVLRISVKPAISILPKLTMANV